MPLIVPQNGTVIPAGHIDQYRLWLTTFALDAQQNIVPGAITDTPVNLVYNGSDPAVQVTLTGSGEGLHIDNANAGLLVLYNDGSLLLGAGSAVFAGRVSSPAVGASATALQNLVLFSSANAGGDKTLSGGWPLTLSEVQLPNVPAGAVAALITYETDYLSGLNAEIEVAIDTAGGAVAELTYLPSAALGVTTYGPQIVPVKPGGYIQIAGGYVGGMPSQGTVRIWVWGWFEPA